jgi:hypothetical protein
MMRPARGARLLLALLLALLGTHAPLCAEDRIVDDVIIVVDEPLDPAAPSAVPAEPPRQAGGSWIPTEHGDIYRAVWRHPEQTFLDSEIGPLPLWTETVYDANGNPRPRFPDVFTKNFLDNPSEATALAYLESSRTRARRYLEASQIMQKTAIDHGFVTAEAFRPPKSELSNDRALTPPYGFTADNWGSPVMTPQQARLAGLKPQEIPQTPGRTTTRQVEVLYFWDHRCKYSMRGFKDFARFGTEIFNRELGPRIITVSMDNDSVTTRTQLDFLQYSGVETHYIENWLDQTELATSMNIRVTPTYVLIDRRTGRLLRYEGLKDEGFLRGALLELVGHKDASWDDVRPDWFRPTDPALNADRPKPVEQVSGVPGESTPVQAPSRTLKAWDPDGQASH